MSLQHILTKINLGTLVTSPPFTLVTMFFMSQQFFKGSKVLFAAHELYLPEMEGSLVNIQIIRKGKEFEAESALKFPDSVIPVLVQHQILVNVERFETQVALETVCGM